MRLKMKKPWKGSKQQGTAGAGGDRMGILSGSEKKKNPVRLIPAQKEKKSQVKWRDDVRGNSRGQKEHLTGQRREREK